MLCKSVLQCFLLFVFIQLTESTSTSSPSRVPHGSVPSHDDSVTKSNRFEDMSEEVLEMTNELLPMGDWKNMTLTEIRNELLDIFESSPEFQAIETTLLISNANHTCNNFTSIELYALQDLYNSANGQQWEWISNGTSWDFHYSLNRTVINPCKEQWDYLICNSQCHIIALIFPPMNLQGYIPDSISKLTQLLELIIVDNQIYTEFPYGISQLTNLQILCLQNNGLWGNITYEMLNNLHNLQLLYLQDNLFYGTIPDIFGK